MNYGTLLSLLQTFIKKLYILIYYLHGHVHKFGTISVHLKKH